MLIVGAGIVGIASAHYLSREGYDVTVIDRRTVGGACSSGNCGYLCPSHVLPLTEPGAVRKALLSLVQPASAFRVKPRLSLPFGHWLWHFVRRCNRRQMLDAGVGIKTILDASMREYRNLFESGVVDGEWRPSGLLHVYGTAAGMEAYARTDRMLGEEFGVAARRIDGEELSELEPALKPGLAGAWYYDGDAFLRPDLLNANWSEYLRQRGVRFIEHCALEDVRRRRGEIVSLQTTNGPMRADHYVIAAGALSTKLASMLECRIPVEPGKGYGVTMQRPERCPEYPMLFPEHNIGVTPFASSYRIASMMEFVGFDTSIPEARIRQLRESAEPYLVEPHTEVTYSTWFGWRPMTWDSLPIIGPVPSLDNAWLATGHNMLGLSMAAATGRLVAELIGGAATHIDPAPYSPLRFQPRRARVSARVAGRAGEASSPG